MKRKFSHALLVFLASLLLGNLSFGQDSLQPKDKEVIQWLRKNAVPISHVKTGNGVSDLRPLKRILKDVKVVGLGENTHGTREYYQLKHRLFEFLVREMSFNGFAIEASYGSCEPINEYVLYGKGDATSVLTAQGYVVWDTEEFLDLIKWMRNYNQNVADDKKVRFYGIDFLYNEEGRGRVLMYLKKYGADAERVKTADSLFRELSRQEKTWFRPKDDSLMKNLLFKLQRLTNYLTDGKDRFIAATSYKQFDEVLLYTQVMQQRLLHVIKDSVPASATPNMMRSRRMANNLFRILDRDKSLSKIIVWAHNVHVSDGHMETGEPNLGYELRKKFGTAYYAVAFEFNQGSYQSRKMISGNIMTDLQENAVSPAPESSMAWYLSSAVKGNAFVNLRAPVSNPVVRQWINTPQVFRYFGWISSDTSLKKVNVKSRYDGIVFIEHATATRQTKNALLTVSKGEGL